MMMNLSFAAPPADLPQTLGTLSALITLLADPEAAQQRVVEIQKASSELREAIEALRIEQAGFAVTEDSHRDALAKASAKQASRLAEERATFDAECGRRKSELDNWADQISQLQVKAQADAAIAVTTRADLERRLALVKEATGR